MTSRPPNDYTPPKSPPVPQPDPLAPASATPEPGQERGGRKGPDPVRYGDWEKAGICVDF